MFVVVLFIPVVAGNIFLESDFRRLPKITERNSPQRKSYTLFDPCLMEEDKKLLLNCAELRRHGENETSEYYFDLHEKQVHVKCDMDTKGGGWTVIQRRGPRENDKKLFEKRKNEYEHHFGDASASYWIGNENLHLLTAFPRKKQVLRIELERKDKKNILAEYDHFEVGSKAENYKLSVGEYKGPDGYDALSFHNKAPFTTTESGSWTSGCYRLQSGGWWFSDNICGHSNLNGRKFKESGPENKKGLGITWHNQNDGTSGNDVFLKVEMKIRDADFEFCMGSLIYGVL
ncbi:techylectin-5B-like [Ixodes scapularis]|uniref:techylectin-5B-like n=1 Tax=Ixodes scapularis TaxID=6945 RepID=UPI001A9F2C1A|nr:techylectin-5B-like [Ixodes scapularis]